MKKKITIHDLAKMLNMTASTISRALNDHPKISQETKELVRKKAEEVGYKRNLIASSLRTGKGTTLGMVVPRINRDFISNVIAGAERICREKGYSLIICQSEEDLEREREALRTLLHSRVSGIMISISAKTNTSEHLETLIKEGVPLVQFDRIRPELPTHCVVNDNYRAAYEATQHLIDQGCRYLVHLSGPRYINIYEERCRGFIDAVSRVQNIRYEIVESAITREKGYEVIKQMFEINRYPDAILAASDYSALGAMLVAKEKRLMIPHQIAIVGFANEPFTALINPSMTSIDQKAYEIGENAAKLLIDTVENPSKIKKPTKIVLIPQLMIRESSTIQNGLSDKKN
ncbi:MAG: LacI family transcriptional regulator [Bacteroidales bacterium]|nr:LacI family transcriptional regulator [Bacteroidales bacterium]